MKYLQLNDIDCYKRALSLSQYVWDIVTTWDWFPKKTLGVQFVTAADSISANIAEGFGRYGKKDKIRFYYFSFGSTKESLDWNEKCKNRKLISSKEYNYILEELQKLSIEIHQLIKFTNSKLKE
jgi:four helix bundle protein